MQDSVARPRSLDAAAERLARLLLHGAEGAVETGSCVLEPLAGIGPRHLEPREAPSECWAVDGGQALVADGRCVSVVMVRAAAACARGGALEEVLVGDPEVHVLGAGGEAEALGHLADRGLCLPAGTPVDVNLLRDAAEWLCLRDVVRSCGQGAVVLLDGDLQPDWRLPPEWAAGIVEEATARGVTLFGVTKHSGLSRGGAPLVAQLEAEAEGDPRVGPHARWWTPVARTAPGVRPELLVSVARLDPAAPYAFRVDAPATGTGGPASEEPEAALGLLASLSDDAAFPGYPWPLSAVDALASCPPWARDQARAELDELLEAMGVDPARRERCFADRHRLMERS